MKKPFQEAVKTEIENTRSYLAGEPVNTIYFGGGTPSLYRPEELQEMVEGMTSPPDPSPRGMTSPPDPSPQGEGRRLAAINKEITLELNPEDVTEEYVAELKKTWFNRFSVGVQSFADEDLTYLNRSHSAAQALNAVKLLQNAGLENISIDLIFGIPGSTAARWEKNLDTAFSLGVPHLSAYALTVEPRTPLAWMIDKQKSAPVSDETQVRQFKTLMKKAGEHGFLQYEISNFCKTDQYARHNTNYWKGIPYLGLGPSAHSYNGFSRRWNISNLSKYIDLAGSGGCLFEEESLTNTQKYNEYVMTSLRTMWGFSIDKAISDFGFRISDLFIKQALPFIDTGLLREISGVYFLTDEGKLFADRVASALFVTDDEA